jgi:hypothetical protein
MENGGHQDDNFSASHNTRLKVQKINMLIGYLWVLLAAEVFNNFVHTTFAFHFIKVNT